MSLYKDIMEKNREKREKEEAAAIARWREEKEAERDAWYKTMERELAHLPTRIPQLKEELDRMITQWLQDERAEPGELEIRPATWEEFEKTADYHNYVDDYPPVEEASRLTLEAGLALHISSQNENLFGGINGILHFLLDEDGGCWRHPNYSCDYSGGDHPFPTRERSYWDEDY